MAVVAQTADLAHPEGRVFAIGGNDLHAALGQAIAHRLTLALEAEGAKVLWLPRCLFTLAIGDDFGPLGVPALEGFGAPSLTIEDQGQPPLGADLLACLGNNLPLKQRQ